MSEQEATAADFARMIAGAEPEPEPEPEPATPEQPAQDLTAGLFGKDAVLALGKPFGKDVRNAALVQLLHGPPDDTLTDGAAVADDSAPDFDGGVRETAPPGPSDDPVADHNELLLELFRNSPTGGGGQW